MVAYFEEVAKEIGDGTAAANRISALVYPALTERHEEIQDFPISAAIYADFVKRTAPLSKQDRVDLFGHMLENSVTLDAAMEKTGIKPVQVDESTLRVAVAKVIADNSKIVADYKGGKKKAIGFLVGQTMKAMKGKADPASVNKILKEILDQE